MASSTDTVAANWYPDPVDPSYERYWDGNDWTFFVRPVHRPAAKPLVAPVEPRKRTRTRNAFSTAALVLGGLSVVFLPLILGAIGVLLGIVGKITGEPNAVAATVAAGMAMSLGLMLRALTDIGVV